MNQPRVLVIGAGAAGLAAATRAKRVHPEAAVTVFESGREFSRGTCSLPYYLSGEIEHREYLQGVSAQELAEAGVELHLETQVLEIHPHQRRVITAGPTLSYDRLIVATGSRPRATPFTDLAADLPGFWKLKTLADADKILADLRALGPRSVAVVGGGYVGLEVAEALRERGLHVTLFQRNSTVARLHPRVDQLVEETFRRAGIEIRRSVEVEALTREQGSFSLSSRALDKKPQTERFDAVALAHGIEPDARLLERAGARLGPAGGVVVSARGETSLSNVYACGDGVELPNVWGGTPRWVPLATTAARLGRVCGENAVGGSLRIGSCQGALTVRLFDGQLGSLGLPEDWAESIEVPFHWGSDSPPFARRRGGGGVIFLDRRSEKIRGLQAFGAEASHLVDLASLACEQGMTLEELSLQDFSYTPPLSSLWHPLYLAYRTRRKLSSRPQVGGVRQ